MTLSSTVSSAWNVPASTPDARLRWLLQAVRWLTECGNGIVEGEEQCDDGNLAGGDGCSPVCRVATPHTHPSTMCSGIWLACLIDWCENRNQGSCMDTIKAWTSANEVPPPRLADWHVCGPSSGSLRM